jgi:hypothetical protein
MLDPPASSEPEFDDKLNALVEGQRKETRYLAMRSGYQTTLGVSAQQTEPLQHAAEKVHAEIGQLSGSSQRAAGNRSGP